MKKKLASTLPNMVLSLGVITIVAGGLLGAMYAVTKAPIERQAREQQEAAIREVAPSFDNDPEAMKWECEENGQTFTVYPAYEGDRLAGAAVKGATMSGFSGEIVVMCGFEADGTIRDYRVLKMAETPGLGSKMETWFRDPAAARSVIGKNPATVAFTVSKDGGDIDAITAATISSRAFLTVTRDAFEAYRRYAAENGVSIAGGDKAEASTGATSWNADNGDESRKEENVNDNRMTEKGESND